MALSIWQILLLKSNRIYPVMSLWNKVLSLIRTSFKGITKLRLWTPVPISSHYIVYNIPSVSAHKCFQRAVRHISPQDSKTIIVSFLALSFVYTVAADHTHSCTKGKVTSEISQGRELPLRPQLSMVPNKHLTDESSRFVLLNKLSSSSRTK